MFITFYQNNSGGYFIQDENVDEYVIIEGANLNDILIRAKKYLKIIENSALVAVVDGMMIAWMKMI